VGCDFMEWIDLAKCRDHWRAHISEHSGTMKDGVLLDSLSDYRIVREVVGVNRNNRCQFLRKELVMCLKGDFPNIAWRDLSGRILSLRADV